MDTTSLVAENSARASERQRISRELHRSTSQLLVALQLHLGQLRRSPNAPILDEMEGIIRDIHESIKHVGLRQTGDDDDLLGAETEIASVFFSLSGSHRRTG